MKLLYEKQNMKLAWLKSHSLIMLYFKYENDNSKTEFYEIFVRPCHVILSREDSKILTDTLTLLHTSLAGICLYIIKV